eukprot:691527-Rhodomonas_salina.1
MAVWIDSAMDGLLVGLALVTGKSAGMFMAAAMAVEMGFLVSFRGSSETATDGHAHPGVCVTDAACSQPTRSSGREICVDAVFAEIRNACRCFTANSQSRCLCRAAIAETAVG